LLAPGWQKTSGLQRASWGLGINDGLAGREALAELLTYADFVNSPLRGLKRLLGLYRPIRSSRKGYWRIYDGRLHRAVTRLSVAYYKDRPKREKVLGAGEKRQATIGDCSGTGIGPRQRGGNPRTIRTGAVVFLKIAAPAG
jgi:hypothetical protein